MEIKRCFCNHSSAISKIILRSIAVVTLTIFIVSCSVEDVSLENIESEKVDPIDVADEEGNNELEIGIKYQIINPESGKCMGVKDGSNSNGANVILCDCDDRTDQQWQILNVLKDDVIIGRRVKSIDSGKSLALEIKGNEYSTNIEQRAFESGGDHKMWVFESIGGTDNEYVIYSDLKNSEENITRCIDVGAQFINDEANIQVSEYTNAVTQRWFLKKLD